MLIAASRLVGIRVLCLRTQLRCGSLRCMLPDITWIRRSSRPRNLALFAHGFTGHPTETWTEFPALIEADPDLAKYDCCFWGYDTSLDPHFFKRLFWSDNPKVETLGQSLRAQLANTAVDYGKIVLVAHSMGGLVVQLFLLEEMRRESRDHLDRITEVVLYATPSNGLIKAALAALVHTQAADMNWFGSVIQDLRFQWKKLVDDRRAENNLPFRLTLVAGAKDKFVPQSTSLDPFPFDEKEIVPGDHVSMVKPTSQDDLAYQILKRRMLRGTPTAAEREMIMGRSVHAVRAINRIRAAASLGDVDDLVEQAEQMLAAPTPAIPLAERALGLALLDYEEYGAASKLLDRYLAFRLPGSSEEPFRMDAQARQQLAIALSGAGDIAGSVVSLGELDESLRNDPETLGILGGRFKRQWLKSETNANVARRARALYLEGMQRSVNDGDRIYNGVNAAYLQFALGEPGYEALVREILEVAKGAGNSYWAVATVAECELLLRQYEEAKKMYLAANRLDHAPRQWTTTGQQALDIIARQGNPEEADAVKVSKDVKLLKLQSRKLVW